MLFGVSGHFFYNKGMITISYNYMIAIQITKRNITIQKGIGPCHIFLFFLHDTGALDWGC